MKTFTKISITLAMTLGLTGGALAGDPKAGAPAPPAKEKAPEAKQAPVAAKKMEMPKPPQELTDMAKVMVGTWKCTGKAAMDPADMTKMTDMKMTMTQKLDLNKFWVRGDLVATGPMPFKGTEYTTYDPTAKKWYRYMVDSMGGSETGWSTGMKDNKMLWEGDMRSSMPGMTSVKTKTTMEMTDGGKGIKLNAEGSMDGKKWMAIWEASCKK